MQSGSDPMVDSGAGNSGRRVAPHGVTAESTPIEKRAVVPEYFVRWTPASGGASRIHDEDVQKSLAPMSLERATRVCEAYAARGCRAEVLAVTVAVALGPVAA